jgi:hypothetical protein
MRAMYGVLAVMVAGCLGEVTAMEGLHARQHDVLEQ